MNALALAMIAAAMSAPAAAEAADSLTSLTWKSRVLVVLAPSSGDPRLAAQRKAFDDARAGARERSLVWIEGTGSGREAVSLRRRFGVAAEEFRAILVGKDGGAKLSASEPIPMEQLFGEVDAMPMRQDEMRRAAGSGGRN